ncbi:hypothetical protein MMPV_009491 [Pyropia vietnamensis]
MVPSLLRRLASTKVGAALGGGHLALRIEDGGAAAMRRFAPSVAPGSPFKARPAPGLVRVVSAVLCAAAMTWLLITAAEDDRPGHGLNGLTMRLAAGKEAGSVPGTSLIAACMNRQDTLRKVLPSWAAVKGVDEVVLVDWSSSPPLADVVADVLPGEDRVRVIRVEGEAQWVLSRAYNLAAGASSRTNLLRVDCDYSLETNFLARHVLPPPSSSGSPSSDGGGSTATESSAARAGASASESAAAAAASPATAPILASGAFYSGHYGAARSENERHMNGALVVKRADLLAIGGYDERLQTYGWDDEDLYRRLVASGLAKRTIDYDTITHVPHGDRERAQASVRFVGVEIDMNALLLRSLPPWSAELAAETRSAYTAGDGVGGGGRGGGNIMQRATPVLRATRVPANLRVLTPAHEVTHAWNLALGRRLHDEWEVPWDLLSTMDSSIKERLLTRLIARAAASKSSTGMRPRLLVAHVQHGLGNRLRAYGSAAAYAAATDRELIVVWQADAHIAANWTHLYEDSAHVVLSSFLPKWPDMKGGASWDPAWGAFSFYNYMEMDGGGALKGQTIPTDPAKSIYFKGAYVMEPTSPELSTWQAANDAIRALKPLPAVRAAVDVHVAAGLTDRVGVHIRCKSLAADIADVPDADAEYGITATATMQRWRSAANVNAFAAEMRAMVAAKPSTKFYVATDTAAAAVALRADFPGAVDNQPRDCDGRDAACVVHALVDLLCLARTRELLGSNWSSFTEAAVRLGAPKPRLAGTHFGVAPMEGKVMKSEKDASAGTVAAAAIASTSKEGGNMTRTAVGTAK